MREHIGEHGFGPWRHGRHCGPGARERGHGHSRGPGWDRGPGREGGEQWRGPFGGHWGGHQGGGPGGRERLERGMLRHVILDVLRDGPHHGYEIIKQVEERTGGRYSPSPGTLYPTLQYLDDLGLVRSDQQDGRRVYQLTDEGRVELDEHSAQAEGFWARFQDHTPPGMGRYEANFLEDTLNDLMRTVRRGLQGAIYSGDQETVRRARTALERCQNEIRDIIAEGAAAHSANSDTPKPENPGQPGTPETPESSQNPGATHRF